MTKKEPWYTPEEAEEHLAMRTGRQGQQASVGRVEPLRPDVEYLEQILATVREIRDLMAEAGPSNPGARRSEVGPRTDPG